MALLRRREIAELVDGLGVEFLDEGEEKLHGAVIVGAVHNAVVSVRVANGDGEG